MPGGDYLETKLQWEFSHWFEQFQQFERFERLPRSRPIERDRRHVDFLPGRRGGTMRLLLLLL